MPFSPFPTLQNLSYRDPSLFIGGGGVGGKGGSSYDDRFAFDDFGNYGLDSPASTFYGRGTTQGVTSTVDPATGNPIYRVNVWGDRQDDTPSTFNLNPQIGQGDYGVRGGGLDFVTNLQRAAEQNRLDSSLSGFIDRGEPEYKISINVLGDLLRGAANLGRGDDTSRRTVATGPTDESRKKDVEFAPNLQARGGSTLLLEQLPEGPPLEKVAVGEAQHFVDPTNMFLEKLHHGLSKLAQNAPRVSFRNNQWLDNITGEEVDIIDARTGRSIV